MAAEYAKSAFSATESFLFQIKEAYIAVRDVFNSEYQREKAMTDNKTREEEAPEGETIKEETVPSYPSKKVFDICLMPFIKSLCCERCETNHCCESFRSCFCAGTCLSQGTKCQSFFYTFLVVVPLILVCYLLWIYYDEYLLHFLRMFEEMETEVAVIMFIFLFIVASQPLAWGYVILNLAAGYRFGVLYGLFVVLISVSIGLAITHNISQRLCNGCVTKSLQCYDNTNRIEAIMKVLDGPSGLKVVALTRLTPIPFGLQNGIFAMSNIKTRHYVAASNIGLFPTQLLNCYMGSTFRSAEDIISHDGSSSGYALFFAQVMIGILLMTYVVRHASKQLNNVLNSSSSLQSDNADEASKENLPTEVKVIQPAAGI